MVRRILAASAILVVLSFAFARILAGTLRRFDVGATGSNIDMFLSYFLQVSIYPTITLLYAREETIADLQAIYPTSDPGSGAGVILASGLFTCTILASSYARKFGFGRGDVVGSYDRLRAPGRGPKRRVVVTFAVAVLSGALLVESLVAGLLPLQPQWAVVTLVMLAAIYLIAIHPVQPQWTQFPRTTRAPTDAERERIHGCYESSGTEPDQIVVFDGPSTSPGLLVAGRTLGRYVWVHESVLEAASDDDLATTLALAECRADRYHYASYLFTGLVGFAVFGFLATRAAVTGTVDVPIVPMTPFVLVAVAGYWYGHRTTRRAEELVGEQYGVERVVGAYENLGSFQTLADWSDLPIPRILRQFHPDPPITWRLERLAEGSSAE